jgi:hypothetical protein
LRDSPWAAELPGPGCWVAVGAAVDGRARLAGSFQGELVVRRKRPEGRFRSVEVVRPWLAGALLGVNESGLAAALADGRWDGTGAPAALLVEDCLQRFSDVDAALDWCLGRPAAPAAVLLFADSGGEMAGVEVSAGGRRVLRPAEGLLVVGGPSAAADDLAKRLRETSPVATPGALGAGVIEVAASERRLLVAADAYAC